MPPPQSPAQRSVGAIAQKVERSTDESGSMEAFGLVGANSKPQEEGSSGNSAGSQKAKPSAAAMAYRAGRANSVALVPDGVRGHTGLLGSSTGSGSR